MYQKGITEPFISPQDTQDVIQVQYVTAIFERLMERVLPDALLLACLFYLLNILVHV